MADQWKKYQTDLEQALNKLSADKTRRQIEFDAAKQSLNKFLTAFKENESVVYQQRTWIITTAHFTDYSRSSSSRVDRKVLACDGVVFDPSARYTADTNSLHEVSKNVRYETKDAPRRSLKHAEYEAYVNLMAELPMLVDSFRIKHYQPIFKNGISNQAAHTSRRENPLVTPPLRRA